MGERERGESETSRYLRAGGSYHVLTPDAHPWTLAVLLTMLMLEQGVRVWGLTLTLTLLGPSPDAGPISYLILHQLP